MSLLLPTTGIEESTSMRIRWALALRHRVPGAFRDPARGGSLDKFRRPDTDQRQGRSTTCCRRPRRSVCERRPGRSVGLLCGPCSFFVKKKSKEQRGGLWTKVGPNEPMTWHQCSILARTVKYTKSNIFDSVPIAKTDQTRQSQPQTATIYCIRTFESVTLNGCCWSIKRILRTSAAPPASCKRPRT